MTTGQVQPGTGVIGGPIQGRWYRRVRRRVVRALGLLVVLFASARAQTPDVAAIVQREEALIAFYGGGAPLSAPERQETTTMVALELQRAPQAEMAADAEAAKLLRVLDRAGPPLIALAREGGRLNAQLHAAVSPALQQEQEMEARIIAAHDPVVVFDAAHKRLISEQTLRVLQQADSFGATLFGVPPPGPAFVAQMQTAMPHAYDTMDDAMRDAMAHAERDMPYAPGFLQSLDPRRRAAFAQDYHDRIMAAPDPAGQQLNLAEVMAVVAMTAYRHAAGGGVAPGGGAPPGGAAQGTLADRLRMQDLTNRQLEGAVRSYSPTCNVTRPDAMANFAYCHPCDRRSPGKENGM